MQGLFKPAAQKGSRPEPVWVHFDHTKLKETYEDEDGIERDEWPRLEILFHPLDGPESSRIAQANTKMKRGELHTDAPNLIKTTVLKCVVGWRGMTPEALDRYGLRPPFANSADYEEERKILAPQGGEYPFDRRTLEDLIAVGTHFAGRIMQLAGDMSMLGEAKRVLEKKSSDKSPPTTEPVVTG